jgi:hypothetical protein
MRFKMSSDDRGARLDGRFLRFAAPMVALFGFRVFNVTPDYSASANTGLLPVP